MSILVAVVGRTAGLYAARQLATGGAHVVLLNRDIKAGGTGRVWNLSRQVQDEGGAAQPVPAKSWRCRKWIITGMCGSARGEIYPGRSAALWDASLFDYGRGAGDEMAGTAGGKSAAGVSRQGYGDHTITVCRRLAIIPPRSVSGSPSWGRAM